MYDLAIYRRSDSESCCYCVNADNSAVQCTFAVQMPSSCGKFKFLEDLKQCSQTQVNGSQESI